MADILGPNKGEKIHLFLLNEHARKVGQMRKNIPNSIKKSPKRCAFYKDLWQV